MAQGLTSRATMQPLCLERCCWLAALTLCLSSANKMNVNARTCFFFFFPRFPTITIADIIHRLERSWRNFARKRRTRYPFSTTHNTIWMPAIFNQSHNKIDLIHAHLCENEYHGRLFHCWLHSVSWIIMHPEMQGLKFYLWFMFCLKSTSRYFHENIWST